MTRTIVVDQAALNLFHIKDAEYDAAQRSSSSDMATLRYLALRAVGLEKHGFTDQEQVPWSKDQDVLNGWLNGKPLSRDCASVGAEFLTEHENRSTQEQAKHAAQERLNIEQDTPAWQTFHGLLVNAKSKFNVSDTFDVGDYTDTLKVEGGYRWFAEEVRNRSSRGRVFVNPMAAAQWLLEKQPGNSMRKMHASAMVCADTNHSFSINEHGTSTWAKDVIRKIEMGVLTLDIQELPVENNKPRSRI